MTQEFIIQTIITIGGAFIAWLLADTRSKARLAFAEEKFATLEKNFNKVTAICDSRLSQLEIRITRSEQDRIDIHKSIERIDTQKASKDVVDGFRSEIATLRFDMDKRFDRLERLIEATTLDRGER